MPRMSCKFKHIWILAAIVANVFKKVEVQFAIPMCPPMMPVPPPPPMYPMPMPMPIIAPMPIPGNMLPSQTSTTKPTTTEATEATKKRESVAVAVPVPVPMPMPMPMPMPVPMGVPAFPPPNVRQRPPPRPNNCPPCPPCVCRPSCTPAMFSYCSPCHMKCRCRNKEDAPEPLPNRPPQGPEYGMAVPMPVMPPPVVVVPYPPPIPLPIHQDRRRPRKDRKSKFSSCSDESTDSSSSESNYKRKRRYRRRKRFGGFRRNLRSSDSENELVKPMLSYVAENGDVKFKTKISGDDVAELLGEKKADNSYQTVQVMTAEDENNRPKVLVLSDSGGKRKRERYKKVMLRGEINDHVLGDGKKELVFRPPGDKKISNLSVSFQIS